MNTQELMASTAAIKAQPREPRYSGIKTRVHQPRYMTKSTHITAKTHRSVPCLSTITAAGSINSRAVRLQMLKDRRA